MTQANFDILGTINAAAETELDQNIATKGGGSYTLPEKGMVRLRMVGYYELGTKDDSFEGKPKITDEVHVVFELSGPKHAPKVLDDGTKIPQRVTVKLHKSTNEKAGYYKLFKAMNYAGKAKIMAQLLGQPFLGTIYHKPWKSDPSKFNVELKDPVSGAFSVRAPIVEDAETGESKTVDVAPPITPLGVFLWKNPSTAMWASIYRPGQYDEVKNDDGTIKFPARSKNVMQERIKAAKNFAGSPIAQLLEAGGDLDVEADKPGKSSAPASSGDTAPSEQPATSASTPAGDDDDVLAAF